MTFVYIPAQGTVFPLWINLTNIVMIVDEGSEISLFSVVNQQAPIAYLSGKQADVLRRHLSGRHLSDRLEPQLPHLPVLDAAQRLEARLERGGRLNDGISDGEGADHA